MAKGFCGGRGVHLHSLLCDWDLIRYRWRLYYTWDLSVAQSVHRLATYMHFCWILGVWGLASTGCLIFRVLREKSLPKQKVGSIVDKKVLGGENFLFRNFFFGHPENQYSLPEQFSEIYLPPPGHDTTEKSEWGTFFFDYFKHRPPPPCLYEVFETLSFPSEVKWSGGGEVKRGVSRVHPIVWRSVA